MADFPDAIVVPRTIANRPGVVFDADDQKTFFAEDLNKANDEIVAVETSLGINPQGIADNVGARIEALNAKVRYACMQFNGTAANTTFSEIPLSALTGNSLFSIVSNRLKYNGTEPIIVKMSGSLTITTWATTVCRLIVGVYKNDLQCGGDAIDMGFSNGGGEPGVAFIVPAIITLNQNDVIKISVYQATGASRAVSSSYLFVDILAGLPE